MEFEGQPDLDAVHLFCKQWKHFKMLILKNEVGKRDNEIPVFLNARARKYVSF